MVRDTKPKAVLKQLIEGLDPRCRKCRSARIVQADTVYARLGVQWGVVNTDIGTNTFSSVEI